MYSGECVLCETTSNRAGINTKPECETVLRELERGPLSPVGSACRGLPSSGGQSRTDSLRNVSPQKGSLSCQRRTRSKQACLVVGVCEHRQRLCVIVSAGVKRDIVDSVFCLFIYMLGLAASPNVEQVCVTCCFVCWCVCSPIAAADRLGEQLEMG